MKNPGTAPLGSAQTARLAASIGLLLLFGINCAVAFDGNPANGIFVDGVGGSNSNPGTITQPKQTIAAGIAAASPGMGVYVTRGTYAESVVMQSGISVYGAYDRATNWSHSFNNVTVLNTDSGGVVFDGVSGETHLEGFHINAGAAAAGATSYAVRINNSPGPVMIRYNTLSSGTGGVGSDGGSGTSMGTANSGGNGLPGASDSNVTATGGAGGTSTCSAAGGSGGAGGYSVANGGPGMSGANNSGSGGMGGGSGNPGGPGSSGKAGSAGSSGAPATPPSGLVGGASILGLYTPPATTAQAADGGNGSGGGGGGGGGGQDVMFGLDGTGNGGGGGGAGGCGGGGAFSGNNGGGSFPVFVVASTATISSNALVIGIGGAGGGGGTGGSGGMHGDRGNGNTAASGEVGIGGNGALGGNGGKGGDGAGGNGGPSIGVFSTGSALLTFGTNRYTRPANGAAGGAAPLTNSANNGASGLVQNTYPLNTSDAGPATLNIADKSVPMGYTGTTTMTIPVSLGPVTDAGVSVNYQTSDGTAVAGQNYVATSGTLAFEPWATTQSIRVVLLGVSSAPKNFAVTLTAPGGATILDGSAIATINYDADVIFRDNFE